MLVRVSIFTPNLAAETAAIAMFLPPSLPYSANALAEPATSAITCDGTKPFCFASCLVDSARFSAVSILPPFNLEKLPSRAAASL